jgi:L-amino acid N-acyltransferase YncA
MLVRKLQSQDIAPVEQIFDKYWDDDFRTNLSDKISRYVVQDKELQDQNFQMLVLENEGDVIAVFATRDAPEHMAQYARTSNPVEFYVLAVQEQNQGYGSILTKERMRVAQDVGYTEAVFFSGETHQDSWDFHDEYAERVSEMTAPNGEKGYIWSALL